MFGSGAGPAAGAGVGEIGPAHRHSRIIDDGINDRRAADTIARVTPR